MWRTYCACHPGPIVRILLSHTHRDHLGGLPGLKAATDAPAYGWHRSGDESFTPDLPLHDGDVVAGMEVVFTPGHAADHVCFARPDGILFSADHVMSWSSSVVSPPGGDMADYFRSLQRLLDRPSDILYLPGHGPPMGKPKPYVAALLGHRMAREEAISAVLREGPQNAVALVGKLYSKIDPILKMAAERNVISHLLKLEREGRAARQGDEWRAV